MVKNETMFRYERLDGKIGRITASLATEWALRYTEPFELWSDENRQEAQFWEISNVTGKWTHL